MKLAIVSGAAALSLAALLGCGEDDTSGAAAAGAGASGTGAHGGQGGMLFTTTGNGASAGWHQGGGQVGGGACATELVGTIRDFSPTTHPDFEYIIEDDRGIVQDDLAADMKPVYAGNPTTPTTHGQEYFDQWFRNTEGINLPIPLAITLSPGAGVFTYDNGNFFPIDDEGFGNEGNPHNYHFTYEIHATFDYQGGEVFTFTGDDDLFTFVNNRLAIDLGGVHGAENQTIDMDAMADTLGISVGGTYALDFFFAERHTSESNFRIDTSIACFVPVTPPA